MQRVLRVLSIVCGSTAVVYAGLLAATYSVAHVTQIALSIMPQIIWGTVAVSVLLAAAKVLDSLEAVAASLDRIEGMSRTD